MGLFDSIFGGGDQKSTTTFELSPEQKKILGIAMPFFENVGKDPPKPPSGSAIAPFNQTQQYAQMATLGTAPIMADFAANVWDGSQYLTGGNVVKDRPTSGLGDLQGRTFTPEQWRSLSGISTGQGTRNPVLDMLRMFTSGDLMDVNKNPALQNAISAATRPIIDATLREALPNVRQDFVGSGQFGGTKQQLAESQALNEMQRNVGDTASLMANRAYETGMQGTLEGLGLYSDAFRGGIENQLRGLDLSQGARQGEWDAMLKSFGIDAQTWDTSLEAMTRALGMAPQTMGLGMVPLQLVSGVGDTQHGMQQAQAQEKFQLDQMREMWDLMLAQEIAGSVGLVPGGTNKSKVDSPSMNPLSAILGGLSLFSGMGGGSLFGFL
jgi:hypothetical protein